MTSLSTYWHTLRYLRPVQLYGRLWFRLAPPRVDRRAPPPRRQPTKPWVHPAQREPSLQGPDRFCFLNETHCLSDVGWDNSTLEKLWRYNLHYFDDLNAAGAERRTDWHRALLQRWIQENRPAEGTPWEPYPTSLRMVNWIKWALSGHELPADVVHSLAIQARWLRKRIETHLRGNHLFSNAKALAFSGAFFEGAEADAWLKQGLDILASEVNEQILPDGGHFERSTMYHALAFEDMLDLLNLTGAYPDLFAPWRESVVGWKDAAVRMGRWLAAVCHPDGEISFFNDAAIGIAPAPISLFEYALRLGVPCDAAPRTGVTWLQDSGYVRVQHGYAVMIADVAKIGPDYLPAHAHADTLSFELSIGRHRVLVNSGTSRYGIGPARDRERSTGAHNTVEIDGQNSTEVWAGFRAARRAYPFDVRVVAGSDHTEVEAAHDGYRRLSGRPVHRRRWVMKESALTVEDSIEGTGVHAIRVLLHFGPDFYLTPVSTSEILANWGNGDVCLTIRMDDKLVCEVTPEMWHPRFGATRENICIGGQYRGPLPVRLLTQLSWQT